MPSDLDRTPDNRSRSHFQGTTMTEPLASAAPRPGLRERKRQRTLSEIQRVALALFMKQGYEETTIEQIAEEAEVSPSTVFRYFPSKEDLVLRDEYDPVIIASLAGGPPGESPVAAIRRALDEFLGGVSSAERGQVYADMLSRGRLMLSVPELRARLWDSLHENEAILAEALAVRAGR